MPKDTNRYGRTVPEVILPDGRSLNREMVRVSLAWWYREYASHDAELARLEAEAKAAKRGLWSRPAPPWEWRRGEGVPQTAGAVGNRRSHVCRRPTWPSVRRMAEKNRLEFDTAERA